MGRPSESSSTNDPERGQEHDPAAHDQEDRRASLFDIEPLPAKPHDEHGRPIEDGQDHPKRGEFNNHCEFFLSSLGLAVGLGNIWRFPYICYSNGGGSFLLPYLLMLFLIGLPMFFLEMSLGQYAGLSATKVFARLAPGLRGMGYGMITIPNLINFQYVVIMAYAMFYLFAGFTSDLPWGHCTHEYNTDHCYSVKDVSDLNCSDSYGLTFFEKTCMKGEEFCDKNGLEYDADVAIDACLRDGEEVKFINVTYRTTSSEDYWYRRVLNLDVENSTLNTDVNSWRHWGAPRWEIMGCLALCWLLICLSLIKGVQSYGKVVYFTTLFPYVVLTITLGYIATQTGFEKGVEFYIIPQDWSKLLEISVWNDAAGQIFYSLGVGVGSQLLLCSYNDFNTNAHRDALLISLANSLTSIYAGFSVFGVIGYIASYKQLEIPEVVSQGPGLTFIVFPEAVALMDVPQLFSFLFFLMLNLLAISSVCGSWEALIAAIMDEFPQLRKKRVIVMFVSCFIAFLCGVAMCFDSGFLLFTLMDSRCGNAIVLMSLIELITISWFYGSDRMLDHIAEMGMFLPKFERIFFWTEWTIVAPAILFAVTILQWVDFQKDSLEDYVYPADIQFLGWMLELTGVLIMVLVSIFVIIKRCRSGKPWHFIQAGPMMSPNKHWGPRPDSGIAAVYSPGGLSNPTFQP